MRTSAFRWSLVFACLIALSMACGESDDGKGGTGGTGGTSGNGDGGTGGGGPGPGGGGGDDPFCGDGVVNAKGEECDDGNTFDNDGCSSECKIEGTCERPFAFRQKARFDSKWNFRILDPVERKWAINDDANSCSVAPDESKAVVFRYDNDDQAGYLRISNYTNTAGTELGYTLAIRRTCDAPATEEICRNAFLLDPEAGFHVSDRVFIEPNESIYLIADFHPLLFGEDIPEEFLAGMGVTIMPVLQEGDACSLDPKEGAWCEEGLACGEAGVCEEDSAPVVTGAKVYFDDEENRLIVTADGTDAPGNAYVMELLFLNAQGTVLEFERYDEVILPYMVAMVPNVVRPQGEGIMGKKEFRAEWEAKNFDLPGASKVSIAFWDLTHVPNDLSPPGVESLMKSDTLVVDIEPLPALPEGELCDSKRRENRCMPGLTCKRDDDFRNKCLP